MKEGPTALTAERYLHVGRSVTPKVKRRNKMSHDNSKSYRVRWNVRHGILFSKFEKMNFVEVIDLQETCRYGT